MKAWSIIILLTLMTFAGKVENMLEYVVLKYIPHYGPVTCKSKMIDSHQFTLCTWDGNKALFLVKSASEIYAINGTAKIRPFTKYNEITRYPNPQAFNIMVILSKFE
jgi:hypothetical protein